MPLHWIVCSRLHTWAHPLKVVRIRLMDRYFLIISRDLQRLLYLLFSCLQISLSQFLKYTLKIRFTPKGWRSWASLIIPCWAFNHFKVIRGKPGRLRMSQSEVTQKSEDMDHWEVHCSRMQNRSQHVLLKKVSTAASAWNQTDNPKQHNHHLLQHLYSTALLEFLRRWWILYNSSFYGIS